MSQWQKMVRQALYEALPGNGVQVTEKLTFDCARSLKRLITEHIESGKPLYFRGLWELTVKHQGNRKKRP